MPENDVIEFLTQLEAQLISAPGGIVQFTDKLTALTTIAAAKDSLAVLQSFRDATALNYDVSNVGHEYTLDFTKLPYNKWRRVVDWLDKVDR